MPLPERGIVVPLVSPLRDDGSFDADSEGSLISHVVDAGVKGVLVLGSSGESGALAAEQRYELAARAVSAAAGRCHVMIGVAALGTLDAVHDARHFEEAGADSLLAPLPFMFTPSSEETKAHFERIADAVSVPVVAYDVPSRVRVALSPRLVAELASAGTIAGVKDSSNDLGKQRTLVEQTRDIEGFVRCTGSEEAIDGLLLSGFHVPMPGLANVFPHLHVALAELAGDGDWTAASARQGEIVDLLDLYAAPLAGGTPVAAFFASVKEALRQLGVIESSRTSFPFTQADDALIAHVSAVLDRARALAA